MTTCARCGMQDCPDAIAANGGEAVLPYDGLAAALGCRERELANLRSLLRSVTGKLEQAAELTHYNGAAGRIEALINQVLEALS